mgnify:CR=1 FL=1
MKISLRMNLSDFINKGNEKVIIDKLETIHNDDERFQDYQQSLEIDKLCKKILEENNIPYHTIKVDGKSVKKIIKLLDVK